MISTAGIWETRRAEEKWQGGIVYEQQWVLTHYIIQHRLLTISRLSPNHSKSYLLHLVAAHQRAGTYQQEENTAAVRCCCIEVNLHETRECTSSSSRDTVARVQWQWLQLWPWQRANEQMKDDNELTRTLNSMMATTGEWEGGWGERQIYGKGESFYPIHNLAAIPYLPSHLTRCLPHHVHNVRQENPTSSTRKQQLLSYMPVARYHRMYNSRRAGALLTTCVKCMPWLSPRHHLVLHLIFSPINYQQEENMAAVACCVAQTISDQFLAVTNHNMAMEAWFLLLSCILDSLYIS